MQPSQGMYELTVFAFNVPVGPQDFALVVTGDFLVLSSCRSSSNEPPVKTQAQSPPVTKQPTVNPSGAGAQPDVMAAVSYAPARPWSAALYLHR